MTTPYRAAAFGCLALEPRVPERYRRIPASVPQLEPVPA